jgi:zinc and cadmium transporter
MQDPLFWQIFLATLCSSVVSLAGAWVMALRRKPWSSRVAFGLTSFSSGVLLTTALLHLAPEAIELAPSAEQAFWGMFLGIVVFFCFERFTVWYHHHHAPHQKQSPTPLMITVGDSIHNFIDGIAVAASFLANPGLGVLSAIAVGIHEVPQEIADFAIMVQKGVSKKNAILWNIYSALIAMVGAAVGYALGGLSQHITPIALAFSAGMFLYIALADLIPELHHSEGSSRREIWFQFACFGLGMCVVLIFSTVFHE